MFSLLTAMAAYSGFTLYQNENVRQRQKEDLIELSKIKYGLLNVDEWKRLIAGIISKKIDEIELTDANREVARSRISSFLHTTIADLEKRYYEEKSKSVMGMIQGSVTSLTGIFDKIKADIPVFTNQILEFIDNEKNKEVVRQYLIEKMESYAAGTFSEMDYSGVHAILATYEVADKHMAVEMLARNIGEMEAQSGTFAVLLLVAALLTVFLLLTGKKLTNPEYLLAILFSLVLLSVGIALPMIEIDARITAMSFHLLGETITFSDQVLYYKSKSIWEVITLMVSQGRIDLWLVGALVFTFSVFFPVLKLVCSILFLYVEKFKKSGFIRFVVFNTAKWSMADVMVISIFMAYIGFDGILSEQLRQMEGLTRSIDLLTTNHSRLLFGFYSFTLFVLVSLLITQKLHNRERTPARQ